MKRISALTAPVMICAALTMPAMGQMPSDNARATTIIESDLKAKNPNGPNPFINNALWREWLKDAHSGAVKYIAEEKAKAEKGKTN